MPIQINQNIDSIDESLFAPGKKDSVRAQINKVTEHVLQHVAEIARNDYMRPIIQSVSSLPIEELALLAESMINITSLFVRLHRVRMACGFSRKTLPAMP